MSQFEAFDIINLQYEIKVCQNIYNRVTMRVYVKCVVRFNMNKMLFDVTEQHQILSGRFFSNFVPFSKYPNINMTKKKQHY